MRPRTALQDGRCIGAGELCGECEGDVTAPKALGVEGMNFPAIPQICVPESDCNTIPMQCADGLQCSPAGVCWMTLSFECRDDGDRWATDTCRTLGKVEDCPQNSVCRENDASGPVSCAPNVKPMEIALWDIVSGYANFPDIPNVCVPELTGNQPKCAMSAHSVWSVRCVLVGLESFIVSEKDV